MLVTKTSTRTDFHNTSKRIQKLASYQLKAPSIWGHRHQISWSGALPLWISRYEKGKTSVDSNEARNDGVWGCSGIRWTLCKLIVILIIIGIPSPTLGLNHSFSVNPPYRSLSFFSFRIHYMDFPYRLLLLLSISVFLLFSFFLFLHIFSCRFRAVD